MLPRTSMRVWYTRSGEENWFDFIVELVFASDTRLRLALLDTVVTREMDQADRGLKDVASAVNHKVEVGEAGVAPSNAYRLAALGVSAGRYEYQEPGQALGSKIQSC